MTSLSLDAGDWEVVDYTGNPVPGNPDAISSLASQFLDQAGQARERAAQLSSVHSSNEDRMQGDYAAMFIDILASLPSHSGALGECYQSCAQALSLFATGLDGIQSQAASALQRGTEADAAYRAALDEFCSVVPVDLPVGEIWRGLNEATAAELAEPMAIETEDPEIQTWAAEIGQYAGAAESDRQQAIAMITDLATDYESAASQCSQALQDAMSSLPSPQLTS